MTVSSTASDWGQEAGCAAAGNYSDTRIQGQDKVDSKQGSSRCGNVRKAPVQLTGQSAVLADKLAALKKSLDRKLAAAEEEAKARPNKPRSEEKKEPALPAGVSEDKTATSAAVPVPSSHCTSENDASKALLVKLSSLMAAGTPDKASGGADARDAIWSPSRSSTQIKGDVEPASASKCPDRSADQSAAAVSLESRLSRWAREGAVSRLYKRVAASEDGRIEGRLRCHIAQIKEAETKRVWRKSLRVHARACKDLEEAEKETAKHDAQVLPPSPTMRQEAATLESDEGKLRAHISQFEGKLHEEKRLLEEGTRKHAAWKEEHMQERREVQSRLEDLVQQLEEAFHDQQGQVQTMMGGVRI